MLADEARTKADAARVTREALLQVSIEQEKCGCAKAAKALFDVACCDAEVLLRVRGLIR